MNVTVSARSTRSRRLIALVAAMVVALALPVSSAGATPSDQLIVNVSGGPAVSPDIEQPTGLTPPEGCTLLGGLPPTGVRCELTEQIDQPDVNFVGRVQKADGSGSGTIRLACALKMSLPLVVVSDLTGSTISYESLSGTGSQRCTWVIRMADGSELTGALTGTMSLALVTPTNTTATWAGTFNVVVLGGTGEWAGKGGSGTYTQSETIALPTSVARSGSLARIGETDASVMALTLAARAPRVQLQAPAPNAAVRLRAATRVQVFTAPGASCRFTARKVGTRTTKQLGTGRDGTPRDGTVTSPNKVASLGLGRWTITAACTAAGRTGRATRTVRVIR
jgi:hypothetical protein